MLVQSSGKKKVIGYQPNLRNFRITMYALAGTGLIHVAIRYRRFSRGSR